MTIILLQPASVAASADSLLVYSAQWLPPGQSTNTSVCVQSGIHDVAQNYAQIVIKNYVAGSCSGANRNVPSGYIGTQLYGYRDGSSCGSTAVYYSNVSTSAWQLWATMCSNPAGVQTFRTLGGGWYWNGSTYNQAGFVFSPNQSY
jgi:hypothetical protein